MIGEPKCWKGGRKRIRITLCYGVLQAAPANPGGGGTEVSLGFPCPINSSLGTGAYWCGCTDAHVK